jgi:hypothetical protein
MSPSSHLTLRLRLYRFVLLSIKACAACANFLCVRKSRVLHLTRLTLLTHLTLWLRLCRFVFFVIFCGCLSGLSAFAAHNPLLPRPREIHYLTGSLPLTGLSIRFTSAPNAEDRFAAEHLASRLSAIAQAPLSIHRGGHHAILLTRTGNASPLSHKQRNRRPGLARILFYPGNLQRR